MHQLCAEALIIANKRKLFCPDFKITYGLRTAPEQFELYKKGRRQNAINPSMWVITDSSKVVTYCDGYEKLSNHQSGDAIDFVTIVKGRVNYSEELMMRVATCFFEAACNLNIIIDWGGSYKSFSDTGHIEIVSVK